MTLNVKSNYLDSRKWSDGYEPHMRQIACNIIFNDSKLLDVHFTQPTNYEDRKLGIDQIIKTTDMKMSFRIRKHTDEKYWKDGFTIRTSAKYGLSELDKIKQGIHADFLLYALADEVNYGEVWMGSLIYLKSVGIQLNQHPSLLENAYKGNGFIELKYDDFPHSVVMGSWNCKYTHNYKGGGSWLNLVTT